MLQAAPGEEFWTKQEVLGILHISNRTLQRRRWDGTIKAFRVNDRFFLYPKSAVEEFIAKLQAGELQTVTFDKKGHPRPKQPPRRKGRRARGSRKMQSLGIIKAGKRVAEVIVVDAQSKKKGGSSRPGRRKA